MTQPPTAHPPGRVPGHAPGSRGTVRLPGVGRRRSIGAGIALGIAEDGWDLVLGYWSPYDERIGLERGTDDPAAVADDCRALGARVDLVEADLGDPDVPERLVAEAAARRDLRGMVLSHCESVDSSILTTTLESWDRHFAVNARAAWLLLQAYARRLPEPSAPGEATGSVVALTSDHTPGNLPYGASKGALDRVVIAAAVELGGRGLRANVVNPGPIDTGWMTDEIREMGLAQTPAGRLGRPSDTADLVRFLLSERGSWVTGQLLHSNGGFATS
jgi:3-oxoacyl-[acyl-carrier protein] reductase